MHTLVIALIISYLDYANYLLTGLLKKYLNQLQTLQNMAAKMVCNHRKFDSSTACLKLQKCVTKNT